MFERLTMIPTNEPELVQLYGVFDDIIVQLNKIIDHDKWSYVWYENYPLGNLAKVMTILETLAEDKTGIVTTAYLNGGNYSIKALANETNSSERGLVINQEAGTHFSMDDFPKAEYLTSAEEYLKQTSQHFLKLFTVPNDQRLYVWTNKPLTPLTYFRLLELQKTIFPRTNPIADEAISAFLNNDAMTFRNAFIKYLTSDAVTEAEYRNFSQCITSSTDREIKKLEQNIDSERSNLNYWEQEILSGTTRIREWNEQIDFLKSKHEDDEETRTLFKLLKKSPYVKSFEAKPGASKILLQYEAPIIYFSDYPAEKYLNKDYVSNRWKDIIKIILGRKYELMTCAALYFKTTNFGIEFAERAMTIDTTALPHPHIVRFHCFGNHNTAIREAAETGNYLGAIEQITQAVMNINFYDSCVINEMLREIANNEHKTIWRHKGTGLWFNTTEILERNDYYEET